MRGVQGDAEYGDARVATGDFRLCEGRRRSGMYGGRGEGRAKGEPACASIPTVVREGVGALLLELEEQLGPPSKADLARARKAWRRR